MEMAPRGHQHAERTPPGSRGFAWPDLTAMHLDLFPATGLDSSLVTAVLVGLYVRFFLTESFGWTFSGLVVPGYLASVAVVLPVSAAVTVFEAIVTLLCVQALCAVLSRARLGTPVFGRDRFLWIVVTSVAVRLLFEGTLAEPLRHAALAMWGVDPSKGFGFYGIGLVLVPLFANACWKPGVTRGLFQNLAVTALTYGVLRALLACTNLSLGSLQLSFERIALDFAASPKAYLLIVAGALIASRANLRFGWDTSGVMIPGLLCLGWFVPERALLTLLEATVLAGLAALFLRLPGPREWNVEGPRRIVLVFSLAYALQFFVLHALPKLPAAHDLMGVGYLLSSLLAVKIWQKKNPALVVVPAFVLSLLGLVSGSLLGYGLSSAFAALDRGAAPPVTNTTDGAAECAPKITLRKALWISRTRLAAGSPSVSAPRVANDELGRFEELVRALSASTTQSCAQLEPLRATAFALGLRLGDAEDETAGEYLVLHERTDAARFLRGFGTVLIARSSRQKAAFVLDDAAASAPESDAVLALIRKLRPAAILVNGLDRTHLRGDAQVERNTPLRAAATGVGATPLALLATSAAEAGLSRFFVSDELASALTTELGPLSRTGFGAWSAELALPEASRARLLGTFADIQESHGLPALWTDRSRNAPDITSGSPAAASEVRTPSTFELKLWLEQIVRPLLHTTGPAQESRVQLTRAADALGSAHFQVFDQAALAFTFAAAEPGDGGLAIWPGAAENKPFVESLSMAQGVPELSARVAAQLGARTLLVDGRSAAAHAFADATRAAVALSNGLPKTLVLLAEPSEEPTTLYLPHGEAWRAELLAALSALGLAPRVRVSLDDRTPLRVLTLFEHRTEAPGATLVVSRADRARFAPARLAEVDRNLLARVGVSLHEQTLSQRLQTACAPGAPKTSTPTWVEPFIADTQRYARERSAALLIGLHARFQKLGVALEVVSDPATGDAFLVASEPGTTVAALLHEGTGVGRLACPADARALAQASNARSAALIVGGKP
jgi:hypothetical protein